MKIILGVTGSVAAFKSLEIGRILLRKGIKIVPVLTRNALRFIGKISFESLFKTEVYSELFPENYCQKEPVHLKILEDVDAILIAPCTANVIGKFANGIADDLLSSVLLGSKAQVFLAPAMHENLWESEPVQENVKKLKGRGVIFIGPEKGELSGFEIGKGRMTEPDKICDEIIKFFKIRKKLKNRKVLLLFGRTEEDIDTVRVISNKSSGKMGCALFETAIKMGAEVSVIKGKTDIDFDYFRMKSVRTSKEMLGTLKKEIREFNPDIIVMNAAVSDFVPLVSKKQKIKRKGEISLKLKPNIDILKEISKYKKKKQIFVGFALEDTDTMKNAKKKLHEKKLDLIVLNKPDVLGSDFTKIWIINKKDNVLELPECSKKEASLKIFEEISRCL